MVNLNNTECELIVCLANEKYSENKKNWLDNSDILCIKKSNKDDETQRLFSSSETNLPKYLKSLEEKGVIIRRKEIKNWDKYRRRNTYHWVWKIKDDTNTYDIIFDNLINYEERTFNIDKSPKLFELFVNTSYYLRINTENYRTKQKEKAYYNILKNHILGIKRLSSIITSLNNIKYDKNHDPNQFYEYIIEDIKLLKDNPNVANKDLMKLLAKKYKIKTMEET